MDNRDREREGGGVVGYHDFLSNNFCLRAPKVFVVEPFRVSEVFCSRKILLRIEAEGEREGVGGYHNFLSIIYCLRVPKLFAGNTLVFTNFVYRRVLGITGVCHDFLLNFFSHSNKTIGRGNLLCFRNIQVSEMFWIIEYPDCVEIFSSLTVPILFAWEPFNFSLFSRIRNF